MRRDDAEQAADDAADERKERVLHTRVPDSLDKHLKRRARTLGMSVSTVVRNVLLTTFGVSWGAVVQAAKRSENRRRHPGQPPSAPSWSRS